MPRNIPIESCGVDESLVNNEDSSRTHFLKCNERDTYLLKAAEDIFALSACLNRSVNLLEWKGIYLDWFVPRMYCVELYVAKVEAYT